MYDLQPLGLTPAVWHDLEGQRKEVIEGGVQHYRLDLWVWHHCPTGWQREWRDRGISRTRKEGLKNMIHMYNIVPIMYCPGLWVPVNPPIDQAYTTMSVSWKPSLWIANWITTSMALASFWGNGTPWQKDAVKKQYPCIIKHNSNTQPTLKKHAQI